VLDGGYMGARRRVDRRSSEADRCSTEGTWVPDGGWECPNGGRDGCSTEGGSRGVAQQRVSGVA
jgi:hypothetical protein